jgi:hypothetical protein
MKCSCCGNPCRVRTKAVIVGKGTGLVCATCVSAGLTVVAPKAVAKCACGKAATVCGACADKRAKRPDDFRKKLAAHLRKLAKAYAGSSLNVMGQLIPDDRAAGLLQAADLVEGWNP